MTLNTNPFYLVADGKIDKVLSLLVANPSLANKQDEHGYSLVHAAASYNRLTLLRRLVQDFSVDVNGLRDEDGETALFDVEQVETAKVLVEELGADVTVVNHQGLTAPDTLDLDPTEESYPQLLALHDYLRALASGLHSHCSTTSITDAGLHEDRPGILRSGPPPPLPPSLSINLSTVHQQQQQRQRQRSESMEGGGRGGGGTDEEDDPTVIDPEFKRRIEQLASRGDPHDEAGQRELRNLVTEAVREHVHVASSRDGTINDIDSRRRRLG